MVVVCGRKGLRDAQPPKRCSRFPLGAGRSESWFMLPGLSREPSWMYKAVVVTFAEAAARVGLGHGARTVFAATIIGDAASETENGGIGFFPRAVPCSISLLPLPSARTHIHTPVRGIVPWF